MAGATRTMFLSFDACDQGLIQEFVRAGELPNFARLFDESAVIDTIAPTGFWVSSMWTTIVTGTDPGRHQYICWDEIGGGTYEYRETSPTQLRETPLWWRLSDAGRRVAVFDIPHSVVKPGLNGAHLAEWGCHERHLGMQSWPPDLGDELIARHGAHAVGQSPTIAAQFSPCDYKHRAGALRTSEEMVALHDELLAGAGTKRAASIDLLDRGGWDLFWSVFGETHCIGHQFWHVHDSEHDRHDPVLRAQLGDPLLSMYRLADETLGAHFERADGDTAVYVHLTHGMGPHHDGTHILDALLWRLDEHATGVDDRGWRSRAFDLTTRRLPLEARQKVFGTATALRRRNSVPPGYFTDPIPPMVTRRWFLSPNNSVVGGVRLNLEGREPNGRIRASQARATLEWLADRLYDVVNVETGVPIVREINFTDDLYERRLGDAMPDLLIEWNRVTQIEQVWSPAVGIVRIPYESWRSGDHDDRGVLLVRANGVIPGRRTGWLRSVDIGVTAIASLGMEFPDLDGRAAPDLVPTDGPPISVQRDPIREPAPRPRRTASWKRHYDVSVHELLDRAVAGVMHIVHATRMDAEAARAFADYTRRVTDDAATAAAIAAHRALELERAAAIATTSAWIRQVDVPADLLVSIVMPTQNRKARLEEAIASVLRQTYDRWELLVVDDGSDDGTADYLKRLDDPRIRPFHLTRVGVSNARNNALDNAHGDVVVYLDDDNRFDADWCKAVAWCLATHPDVDVCYGARVFDDNGRAHFDSASGLPGLQFLPWDRAAVEEFNRVDMNVLAHRRGVANARFDPRFDYYADWDLVMKLTAEKDPFELPVIATYYATNAPNRLSDEFGTERLDEQYRAVRYAHDRAQRS